MQETPDYETLGVANCLDCEEDKIALEVLQGLRELIDGGCDAAELTALIHRNQSRAKDLRIACMAADESDLASLLRLHETIKKVKSKNEENKDKISKLDLAFKQLGNQI